MSYIIMYAGPGGIESKHRNRFEMESNRQTSANNRYIQTELEIGEIRNRNITNQNMDFTDPLYQIWLLEYPRASRYN